MKYYVEITLLPNSDLNLFSLWSKAFQQLHLGLVEMQDDQGHVSIGISFPEYITGEKYNVLGSKLRLVANEESTLTQFNVTKWLSCLSDYVHCTSIRSVPEKLSGYAVYQREQPKTSKERLARRYAKRHNLDYETALTGTIDLTDKSTSNADYKMQFRYCDMPQRSVSTPFIRLKSLSSDKAFCLWIKKTVVAEPSVTVFSTYGLSAASTVPEF
jgi:CRISPR-associated endonuclease Csy4